MEENKKEKNADVMEVQPNLLAEIQKTAFEKLKKSNVSDKGGFSYCTLNDLYELLHPFQEQYGVTVLFDEKVINTSPFCIEVHAQLLDKESKVIGVGTGFALDDERLRMYAPQRVGAMQTYARKYALFGLFGYPADDPDSELDKEEVTASKEDLKKFIDAVNECDTIEQLSKMVENLPQALKQDKKFITPVLNRKKELQKPKQ